MLCRLPSILLRILNKRDKDYIKQESDLFKGRFSVYYNYPKLSNG